MNGFYDFRSYRRTIQETVLIKSISLIYIAFFFVLKDDVNREQMVVWLSEIH